MRTAFSWDLEVEWPHLACGVEAVLVEPNRNKMIDLLLPAIGFRRCGIIKINVNLNDHHPVRADLEEECARVLLLTLGAR